MRPGRARLFSGVFFKVRRFTPRGDFFSCDFSLAEEDTMAALRRMLV
jgi:hypothetical protein